MTLCAVGALAVAGCGGGSSSSTTSSSSGKAKPKTTTSTAASSGGAGAGGKLVLVAENSGLKFDKSSLSAPAGKVTIAMTNKSGLSHDVAIKGNGVDQKGQAVGQDGKSTVAVDLKPGTYEFYCSVDGHEAAGMKGTLTVK
jgi:plastocyanin